MRFTSDPADQPVALDSGPSDRQAREMRLFRIRTSPYRTAWELQKTLHRLRGEGVIPDSLILTEHPHVYTLGTSSDRNHLLAGAEELRASGADVVDVDRGGDITYHGPGQLVGYPILNLHDHYLDLHRYLRDLEEVMIRTLADFGIQGTRDTSYTGVWVGGEKIAAIGVKASHWITMHGFALNISTDLGYFDRIIPCGIFHRGVASMEKIANRPFDIHEVAGTLCRHMAEVFRVSMSDGLPEDLPVEFQPLLFS